MSTVPDPLTERIAANAEYIAGLLGRRLSSKRLSGAARHAVRLAVFGARQTGDLAALEVALADAATLAPMHERGYVMARLLVEAAFTVAPGSPLERRLAEQVESYFRRCRSESPERFSHLRTEFVTLQRSSLSVIRRLAGQALVSEPPDQVELMLLGDDQQPHDARSRIGERVLLAAQATDFPLVLDYYVKCLREGDRRRPEHPATIAAGRLTIMLEMLIGRPGTGAVIVVELLRCYVNTHRQPAIAGGLMRLLRQRGDPLVEQLTPQFRETPDANQKAALAKLLAHMAQHAANVLAVESLTDLLIDTRGPGGRELTDSYIRAATGVAWRTSSPETDRIRAAFWTSIGRLEVTSDPVLRSVAQDLRRLFHEGINPGLVEAYLRGEVSDTIVYGIRNGGIEVLTLLTAAAWTAHRSSRERHRAITMLGKLRNPHLRDQAMMTLWELYERDLDLEVRALALRAVATRRTFTNMDRERLAEDRQSATGQLRTVFDDLGHVLFPAVELEEKPAASGSTP